jgi:two-component system LytT family response regulator
MTDHVITSIIVDDEKPSCEALANYLQEYCPNIRVIGVCNNAGRAFDSIIKLKPQLVFLDVEMPNGTGFDLLKMFGTISFTIIFITAFSEYAIQAFRFSATDYLLKPIKVAELVEAVKKVEEELLVQNSLLNVQTLLQNVLTEDEESRRLVIFDSKGFIVLNTAEIILCEADGYCTKFHLKGNKTVTSSHNLKYYEELLPASRFLRIHNSYIINIGHVTGYSHSEEISLSENRKCPLSNSHKKDFLRRFKRKELSNLKD